MIRSPGNSHSKLNEQHLLTKREPNTLLLWNAKIASESIILHLLGRCLKSGKRPNRGFSVEGMHTHALQRADLVPSPPVPMRIDLPMLRQTLAFYPKRTWPVLSLAVGGYRFLAHAQSNSSRYSGNLIMCTLSSQYSDPSSPSSSYPASAHLPYLFSSASS